MPMQRDDDSRSNQQMRRAQCAVEHFIWRRQFMCVLYGFVIDSSKGRGGRGEACSPLYPCQERAAHSHKGGSLPSQAIMTPVVCHRITTETAAGKWMQAWARVVHAYSSISIIDQQQAAAASSSSKQQQQAAAASSSSLLGRQQTERADV